MKQTNSVINQFFGVDGIEKVEVTESGNIYKKEAFNAFMMQQFPQNVENGAIIPSKYESTAKKARKVLRTLLLQICEIFARQSTKSAKEKFAIQFAKFYSQFYIVNDYSVNSVTNGKMKAENIAVIANVLPEINAILSAMKVNTNEKKSEKKSK